MANDLDEKTQKVAGKSSISLGSYRVAPNLGLSPHARARKSANREALQPTATCNRTTRPSRWFIVEDLAAENEPGRRLAKVFKAIKWNRFKVVDYGDVIPNRGRTWESEKTLMAGDRIDLATDPSVPR